MVMCVLLVSNTQRGTQNGLRVSTAARIAAFPFQNQSWNGTATSSNPGDV